MYTLQDVIEDFLDEIDTALGQAIDETGEIDGDVGDDLRRILEKMRDDPAEHITPLYDLAHWLNSQGAEQAHKLFRKEYAGF